MSDRRLACLLAIALAAAHLARFAAEAGERGQGGKGGSVVGPPASG